MKKYFSLYTANVINSFGSWLTFLAIALITQEKYGTQYVAIVFLVQTLPAILFSRSLARLIPEGRHEQVFVISQILLALNCLVLVANQSLPVIFVHLFVASTLRSISMPLLNSLIGKSVPKESLTEVFTRVGALQSGTLAFAPMAGAWLKVMTSASFLFAVDAASFVISLIFLIPILTRPSGPVEFQFRWRTLFTEMAPYPKDLSAETRRALKVWFLFLTAGAFLNAIEFPGFEAHRLSEQEIGYTLGAWGVGSLLAFLVPLRRNHLLSACLFLGAMALFVWPLFGPKGVIAAFFFGGLFASYFTGGVRAELQESVAGGANSASMWAYSNQVTQFINLIAYASAGMLLTSVGFQAFSYLMLACGVGLAILCWQLNRPAH